MPAIVLSVTDALLDLRDLFNTARALRRFAWQPDYAPHRDLFLDAAAVLDARAFFIATGADLATDANLATDKDQGLPATPHARVNVLV